MFFLSAVRLHKKINLQQNSIFSFTISQFHMLQTTYEIDFRDLGTPQFGSLNLWFQKSLFAIYKIVKL